MAEMAVLGNNTMGMVDMASVAVAALAVVTVPVMVVMALVQVAAAMALAAMAGRAATLAVGEMTSLFKALAVAVAMVSVVSADRAVTRQAAQEASAPVVLVEQTEVALHILRAVVL